MLPRILDYPGSKWRIADWIIQHFPVHKSYVEPFAGSAAVFFRKEASRIETLNDMDGDIINLFNCIRIDPERLAFLVSTTPYSRIEYDGAWSCEDAECFERARAFLVKSWQGFGFRVNEKTGWKKDINGREYAYAVKHWNKLPDSICIVAERLKQAQIEQRSALEIIKSFNRTDVLIYADPPYLLETRNRKQYKFEMDSTDRILLLEALSEHKGAVILSGYDNDLYNSYLLGWKKDHIQSNAQGGLHRMETIWIKKAEVTHFAK